MIINLILAYWLCFTSCQEQLELIVTVEGIEAASGYIMVAVYDSDQTFLTRNTVTGEKFAVGTTGTQKCSLHLAPGKYAISIYHDVDADGELDSNLFKIPTEPTGFSNDVKTFFGPPDFEKVVFTFKKEEQAITIRLR